MPLRNRPSSPLGNRWFKRATQSMASAGVDRSVEFEAQRSTRNTASHGGLCWNHRPASSATRDRYGLDRVICEKVSPSATLTYSIGILRRVHACVARLVSSCQRARRARWSLRGFNATRHPASTQKPRSRPPSSDLAPAGHYVRADFDRIESHACVIAGLVPATPRI
jgi:hypothetical protein